MSKRLLILLMVFMLVSMLSPGNISFAADGDKPVDVVESSANGGHEIRIGDEFELYLKIRNNTGGTITDVSITFSGSAPVKPVDSELRKDFAQSIGNGEIAENVYTFFYNGDAGLTLSMNINYTDKNGEQHSEPVSIWIQNLNPDAGTGGGTGVGEKFKPRIVLGSKSIPEAVAGGKITIPLTLANMSAYEAKFVTIKPTLPENVFDIDQMLLDKTIDSIPAKKADNVIFRFDIDSNAQTGTYRIPLTITYTNVYGTSFPADTIDIYIKVINNELPPELVVKEAKSSLQEIPEEQDFKVTFVIQNMGTLEAKNATIELQPDNTNFYVLDSLTKHYFSKIDGQQSVEVTYSLKTKKDMVSDTYGIKVGLKYETISGNVKSSDYTMYVNVLGTKVKEEEEEKEKDDINIITENVNSPQDAVLTEHPFTTSFNLKNIGTTPAKDVKVTVEGGDKILPRSLNVMNISQINPGESVPVAFSFAASSDAESKSYAIKAVIDYKNNDVTVSKVQYIGVMIENPKEDEEEETVLNTVPKIIISEYSTDPVMVNAGENFVLRMKFLNTSKLKAVQNLKITLVVNESSQETGSVFSPVQSSNTFYIDYLAPGKTSEKEMVMYTVPDAKAKTYVVKAIFEYEYEEKDQVKTNNMEDLFGIPVVQPAKLETSDVIVPEPAYVGEPLYIMSEFYNMGKVTLSNLMVKVEGDFDTKESNYFVGNFEMGSSDYYEAPITPLNPGETKGLLVFTFEDSAGKEHRIEKEFTVNAMESAPAMNPNFPFDPGMVDPGMINPDMANPQGSKFPFLPVGIGAGVVILIIVFIIIRKRRKKKKELMLNEDI